MVVLKYLIDLGSVNYSRKGLDVILKKDQKWSHQINMKQ